MRAGIVVRGAPRPTPFGCKCAGAIIFMSRGERCAGERMCVCERETERATRISPGIGILGDGTVFY